MTIQEQLVTLNAYFAKLHNDYVNIEKEIKKLEHNQSNEKKYIFGSKYTREEKILMQLRIQ